MERGRLLARDLMSELDEAQRLLVVEASCVYRNTLTMDKASHPAVVDASYSAASTFQEATRRVSRDPRVVSAGYPLSIPLVLDALATLFDTCLLDRVDSVIIHYGGTVVVRFTNTAAPWSFGSRTRRRTRPNTPAPRVWRLPRSARSQLALFRAPCTPRRPPWTSSCQLSLPTCLPLRVSLSRAFK